jgi:hypothetical protein
MEDLEFYKNKFLALEKRLKDFPQGYRQNIVILADDDEEISYLLGSYFKSNRLNELIYIHASTSYTDQKDFFKSVVFSLLSEYISKEDTLDNLIHYNSAVLSTTTDYIKNIIKKTDSPSFLEILETINKFISESGKKCVFTIENFLGLKKLFPKFCHDFAKFIMLQRDCMVILSSSQIKETERLLSSELNFLFGNFEKIFINENQFLDNYIYLQHCLYPLPCSPIFVSFFVNTLGSNLVYYNLIKEIIKENYNVENEEASIVSVLEKSLYLKETYFFQKFIKKLDLLESNFKDYSSAIKLLIYISEGYIRKKELLSLRFLDSKNLNNKLQKLSDMNYIENLGNIYKVKDPLFSFWISHVFKLSLLDLRKKKGLFEKEIRESICLFKEDFIKDKLKKILELISAFKDDVLRIGKNRYKLPLIEKTKIISYPEKNLHLLIGEGKEIIFVGIKEKNVEDGDIFDFIEKGSSIKGKGVKKIFISLDKFSPTARLAAKNNKLIAWDVNEINYLLRTYNKPVISFVDRLKENKTSESLSNF